MKPVELPKSAAWGIAIPRIAVGIVFLMHGGQKLFVLGLPAIAGMFTKMGMPMPWPAAVLSTLTEFLGGLAYLIGWRTRLASIPLAVNMAVAVFAVHFQGGFFAPRGFEYPFTLLAAHLGFLLMGSGALSIDALLNKRKS